MAEAAAAAVAGDAHPILADISGGAERFPVPVYNTIDQALPPSDFHCAFDHVPIDVRRVRPLHLFFTPPSPSQMLYGQHCQRRVSSTRAAAAKRRADARATAAALHTTSATV